MRVVFMGTPDFAVPTLEALIENHEVVGVVTQPDKRKGRGKAMAFSPVKEKALEHEIPVYQPVKVREEAFVQVLRELDPEVIVVAAFGQILPESILNMPKYGCINVHASLLPKYRGGAPVHYAILNGEKESGVTIMQMDIGMDTGDMLAKVVVPIGEEMTMGELHDELKEKGAQLLLETIESITDGTVQAQKQEASEATYASLLQRSMEKIDWQKSAADIHNLIRGFNPAPGAFTKLPDGKNLKIWSSKVVTAEVAPAGTVVSVGKKSFVVACGSDALEILEVQPESKKRMSAQVFCNGRGVYAGDVLGEE